MAAKFTERFQVKLTKEQKRLAKQLSQRRDISIAEIIRTALDRFLKNEFRRLN